jgi:hypothetical protein
MNWPEVLNVRPVFLCFLFLASARISVAGDIPARKEPVRGIEQMMTSSEREETGISRLSCQQKEALNTWLLRYTLRILSAKEMARRETPGNLQSKDVSVDAQGSNCDRAIESHISGDFRGWTGETTFTLDSGEIWKQAEGGFLSSYSYSPIVTIYETTAGCRMMVEDEEDTILVRRIK